MSAASVDPGAAEAHDPIRPMTQPRSSAEPLRALTEQRAAFVAFVQGRVRDPALAEDIVQACLVKAAERLAQLQRGESASAWFYRMLRNEISDQRRRQGTRERAALALEHEQEPSVQAQERTERACACVSRAVQSLKPEYAEALDQLEVRGAALQDFARLRGISASNAAVRAFRARKALRKQVESTCGSCAEGGGCFDCSCDPAPGVDPGSTSDPT